MTTNISTKIISPASLRQEALNRRIAKAEKMPDSPAKERILGELQSGIIPYQRFKAGQGVEKMFKPFNSEVNDLPNGAIAEFITSNDYASAWKTRQRYEIDTGRDLVPALWPFLYNVISDPSLDETIDIFRIGPGGFVFEEVKEGGEVKFAQIGESDDTIKLRHFAVGLEYTEDLFIYNRMWRVSSFERNVGEAHNALGNHIHLSPILNYSYGAGNLTDGTTLNTFYENDDLALKYARTLEAAVTEAKQNNRRGNYVLLMNSADIFTMWRALYPVPQQGFAQAVPAINAAIGSIIEYDGWSGTRGKLATTYAGVAAGTAYLIDLSYRDQDFQSFWKHQLRYQTGNPDTSRFIMAQNIWDSRFGVFTRPERAVQKITLPAVDDGLTAP